MAPVSPLVSGVVAPLVPVVCSGIAVVMACGGASSAGSAAGSTPMGAASITAILGRWVAGGAVSPGAVVGGVVTVVGLTFSSVGAVVPVGWVLCGGRVACPGSGCPVGCAPALSESALTAR